MSGDGNPAAEPRLSSTQLFDLYRRLDVNGDGELDMTEFIGVGKKLNFEDENLLVAAFRQADSSCSGKLDMDEFVDAYDCLYSGKLDASAGNSETFIRATRYGIDKSRRPAKYVMQVYKGSILELETFQDLLQGSPPQPFTGDLTTLADMMVLDGENNEEHGSNILWWVDASAMDVMPGTVGKIIKSFGLPEDIDTCFYNAFLSTERDTRLRMGQGKISKGKMKAEVKTLSFFVQSLWLCQRPLVHEFDPRLEKTLPAFLLRFVQYISSRFSQFLSYAAVKCKEKVMAIQRAEEQAMAYVGVDSVSKDDFNAEDDVIIQNQLPVPKTKLSEFIEPAFPLTYGDLKTREPRLIYDNLSLHLMDMGFGPNCLLTFHKMDNEASVFKKDMGYDKEQLSRSGIVGRLVYGVFKRLYVVMKLGGAVPTGGELMDSSFYLVTSLIHLLHNGSMDALSQIEMWMAIVEADIDEMVVKKHIYHIRSIIDICENMKNYIEPFNGIMKDFVEQVVTDSKNKKSLRRSQQVAQAQAQIQAALSTPSKAAYGDEESTYLEETKTPMTPIGGTAAYRSPGQTPASKGTGTGTGAGTSEKDGVVFTPEEPYIDSKHFLKTLSLSTMMPFMRSEAGLSAAKSIREGNEQLEMKGSVFWVSRIEDFIGRAELLKAGYKNKLDEKTNFWTFVLSLFTFFIFPLQCMAGYWGMNFDNMVELSGEWWPLIPGISLLWALSAVVYGLMLIIALHYRIIYSAT